MRGEGILFVCCLAILLVGAACAPAKVVQMGPKIPPRPDDCDIEVLKKGAVPSRPYRDIGLVELENCQDYLRLPCRRWLTEAACKLGGQVAYLPNDGGPVLDTAPVETPEKGYIIDGPVTYRILVAAYVADLEYNLDTDPVVSSRVCKPACKPQETCVNGTCKPTEDCKVKEEKATTGDPDDFESGRCPE